MVAPGLAAATASPMRFFICAWYAAWSAPASPASSWTMIVAGESFAPCWGDEAWVASASSAKAAGTPIVVSARAPAAMRVSAARR